MDTRTLIFTTSLLLFLSAGMAHAGPNAGGTLIVHATPEILWTDDTMNLCELAQIPDGNCANANTNLPGGPSATYIWWITAAFPNGSSPRLSGVTFGIGYDNTTLFLLSHESCGDFALPDGQWPNPGSGNAVTWGSAQTDQLVTVYSFAGYEYYGNDTSFCIVQPPVRSAIFADDSVPAELDPVVDFGCLGFNGDPGYLACPDAPPLIGACCLPDGFCELLVEDDCDAAGGTLWYPDESCEPNPCETKVGACCIGETCTQLTETDCLEQGGIEWYAGVGCEPNPCVPTPSRISSWGKIKSLYW